ncbi:MAG: cell division protein SepF [Negativicutes bacterium]|jgi:cell division inhibitor SepF
MFGKLWKWLGLADIEEEVVEQPEPATFMFNNPAPVRQFEVERPSFTENEKRYSSITAEKTGAFNSVGVNIAVIQPQHFEDSQRAVDYIKKNQQVVLDCSQSSAEVSRRVIDFLSGAIYAVNGVAKPVGNNVFIFAPENTEVN